eukprot:TRINITY_DN104231_c0_g1_i1.p1 TRINITY_DN104231_c0_g1~~TRINITY_DN104231_c0_g1_i1.p1  ORF type:complete len:497 (+),score=7.82 TRINITY_DN104231_c0_g1_i1:99-1589(+)
MTKCEVLSDILRCSCLRSTNPKIKEAVEEDKSQPHNAWFRHLAFFTICGAGLGVGIGLMCSDLEASERTLELVRYPGELFLRSLKLIVLPLIAATMVTSVAGMGTTMAGRATRTAILYYFSTTVFAAAVGIGFFNAIRPGDPLEGDLINTEVNNEFSNPNEKETTDVVDNLLNTGRTLVPENLAVAFVEMNLLGVIVFGILLGVHLPMVEKGEVVVDFCIGVSNAMIALLYKIVHFTPFGVMSLVAGSVGKHAHDFDNILSSFGMLLVATLCACVFHMFIFYPICFVIFTRKNPFRYMWGLSRVWITAFSTQSSAAALSTNQEACKAMGVRHSVVDFVLPIGATVNMDGGAIYYPLATLFIARLADIPTPVEKQIVVLLVGCLISLGTSPIPAAGLVNLIVMLEAADVPVINAVSILFSFEWFLDAVRTTVNVTGDAIGAACVDSILGPDSGDIDITLLGPDGNEEHVLYPGYGTTHSQAQGNGRKSGRSNASSLW